MVRIVRNPYSGEVVAELPIDEAAQIDGTLERARAAQRVWRELGVDERCARVAEGVRRFLAETESIARDVTRQMGKPLAQARAEVGGFQERAEVMLELAPASLAPVAIVPHEGLHRRIVHEPLGVVLDLAAWNYPLLIPVNVVVPALLAGNVVVLKHSALTPLSGRAFACAFGALEPEGLVQDLVMGHEATARVVRDPRVAHVSFTGSVEGGRAVQRAARERFIDVGLELGGKDPAYVAADADLDATVAGIVDGACYNAGQSCCAIERVYVHASRYEEVLERADALLAEYRMGDPMNEATTLGPLARASALGFLEDQVAAAVAGGARLVRGGTRADERFFPATLVADCDDASDLMRVESFGPIVACRAVADDEEALARMNDSGLGLTASVWTADRGRAEWFASRLEVGTVFQNKSDYLDPRLPWTGVKDTGRGVTLSHLGFLHLTRPKALNFRDP